MEIKTWNVIGKFEFKNICDENIEPIYTSVTLNWSRPGNLMKICHELSVQLLNHEGKVTAELGGDYVINLSL